MDEIIEFLIRNAWLVVLIVAGVLGNIGSSAARRQQQQRQRQPRPRPPVEPASPRPPAEDDIARRIREVLGAPREEVAAEPPPQPAPRAAAVEPAQDAAEFEAFEAFEGFEGVQLEDRAARRGPARTGAALGAGPERLPASGLGRFEEATGIGWLESSFGAGRRQPLAAGTPVRRRPVIGELGPRSAVLSMLLLGPPRALESFEQDPSRSHR